MAVYCSFNSGFHGVGISDNMGFLLDDKMTFVFQIGKKMCIKEDLETRLIARNHAKKLCNEYNQPITYHKEGDEFGEEIKKI